MDKKDLVAALKSTAKAESELLDRYPAQLSEEKLAFLGPWTAWKVQVQAPNHPVFLYVVHKPGDCAWVISRGAKEYDLFRDQVKPEVKDEAAAIEAAQWFLRATGGKRFWLIQKLEDIPFLPEVAGDEARTRAVQEARTRLTGKVTAPSVACVDGDFSVRVCGMLDRTLFAYTVTVTGSGRITYQTERIADELPVVWVR